MEININKLDNLYNRYNHIEYVHPDPLEFLYFFSDIKDREIVGLIASSLAYGRVNQILKSVSYVLNKMGKSPYDFLMDCDINLLYKVFEDFKHRFTTGEHLSLMLDGIRKVILDYGSLNECFMSKFNNTDETILTTLNNFAEKIKEYMGGIDSHLIPLPEKKSACKRLNLFLRWMIRKDNVDPGGWNNSLTSKLLIPLDVHMHKISLFFGLTERKNADMKTVIEITNNFKKIMPNDPVKYDFVLTRIGIRKDIIFE